MNYHELVLRFVEILAQDGVYTTTDCIKLARELADEVVAQNSRDHL